MERKPTNYETILKREKVELSVEKSLWVQLQGKGT
jgi:hypothetical protein